MKEPTFCGYSKIFLLLFTLSLGQVRAESLTNETARSVPAWLRDGVVYELFPRDFSPEGNFQGITARLDELKDLGVDILWLMPIHPPGEKMRKGTIGSPYAVKDFYGSPRLREGSGPEATGFRSAQAQPQSHY